MQILVNVSVFRTNFVTIQVVFVNIFLKINRIFTLVLHYSCIPSYNNIVKIVSTRPAVAGLINSPAVAGLIKKSSCSWTFYYYIKA